jgi:hypothetical protein
VRHERRRFANRDDAQSLAFEKRADRGVPNGAMDEKVWRGGFNRAARD